MDIKDVYRALQQGDIDGQENPYSVIHANKFYETQKYLSDSGHVLDLTVFIANKKALANLNPEQQKAIRDSAKFAVTQQHKMAAEGEAVALAGLKDKGMQFDPLPPATRVAIRKATSVVIDSVRKRIGAELVDKVVARLAAVELVRDASDGALSRPVAAGSAPTRSATMSHSIRQSLICDRLLRNRPIALSITHNC